MPSRRIEGHAIQIPTWWVWLWPGDPLDGEELEPVDVLMIAVPDQDEMDDDLMSYYDVLIACQSRGKKLVQDAIALAKREEYDEVVYHLCDDDDDPPEALLEVIDLKKPRSDDKPPSGRRIAIPIDISTRRPLVATARA